MPKKETLPELMSEEPMSEELKSEELMSEEISVEVAYASETKQFLKSLRVAKGTTVIEAIQQSGVCGAFPGLDVVAKDQALKAHDRVEIYRPLTIDPKEARRRRATKKRN